MLKNITLEMSLKPFRKTDGEYIKRISETVFDDWKRLIDKAECASILLWTADGSELLDYTGELDKAFEWGKWGGDANRPADVNTPLKGLYRGKELYCENPPEMTYRILKTIVESLKTTGEELFPDKRIRVGTTFDPGPEFAISSFKYERHNEICRGNGDFKAMICAHDILNGDSSRYAAYPQGIPDKTPFGTFFGKQAQIFMRDMGFDYIWMSNGIGFGSDTWSPTGEIFDGKDFHIENFDKVKKRVYEFWELFSKECSYPVETRGTNMTMGIDLVTDGVPLRDIYDKFDIIPPPNSPWAAINLDFGLELAGYMSRIAHIPSDRYMFRYYLHDPWWQNSPWYDRYNSMPHDIYLPLACSRLDKDGRVGSPTHMSILTIDNTRGNMPEACIVEPLPHFLRALRELPDAPAPVVWAYPFDEYSESSTLDSVKRVWAEDWFMRGAINYSFPVSSVVSTTNFLSCDKSRFLSSVIVTPVPRAGSDFEKSILGCAKNGQRVIFYGSTASASPEFLSAFGISHVEGISGELEYILDGQPQKPLFHDPAVSAGRIIEKASKNVFASAGGRAVGIFKENACWVRATVSTKRLASSDLKPRALDYYSTSESIMLSALSHLGFEMKCELEGRAPVVMLHRHNNAYIFTAFHACTVGRTLLRLPLGIPVLNGHDVKITDGFGEYHFPKFDRAECRVFVEQEDGIVSVLEEPPVSFEHRRRIRVMGLKNATVRILAENYCKNNFQVSVSGGREAINYSDVEGEYKSFGVDTYFEAKEINGNLVFSMPEK